MDRERKYEVGEFNLSRVRNRNEIRVIEALKKALAHTSEFCGCQICIEDIYAAAMNQIPAHYVQNGAIVLRPRGASGEEIEVVVGGALELVKQKPNHPA